MTDEAEFDAIEGGPISMSAFVQVHDFEGGDILLNVREIVAVFGLQGSALAAAPGGTKSRIALRGGQNVPTTATVAELAALLSSVAIVAGPFDGEQSETLTAPSPLYTPER